jgi:hypothetical protein
MFTVDEHKFEVHELMYTDGKHKYTEREFRIPANNARFL